MVTSTIPTDGLSQAEREKREGLAKRKPYVAKKLANISQMEDRGEISPIIRLEKSYLCNFQCTHCSAEYYMDRHLEKVLNTKENRQLMDLDDVRELSRQADEYGIFRFVLTGGEAILDKTLDQLIEALDPMKHLIILDTNGWFFDEEIGRG